MTPYIYIKFNFAIYNIALKFFVYNTIKQLND